MNTNNTGSLREAVTGEGAPFTRRPPWTILILLTVGLLLALYIGTQVLGVLVGMAFPPAPPLLSNATLISHASTDYGVDEWVYETSQHPCEVVVFYEANDGTCEIMPSFCAGQDRRSLGQNAPDQNVAQCSGKVTFSIFAMRWDAAISTGADPQQTRLSLSREVFWMGTVPPREFPLPESSDLGDN